MQETEIKETGLKRFALKYLCDPVLIYTVIVMMSIMYHYRDKLAFFYGAISLVLGFLLFRLFDYMNKHKLLGGIAYCFVGTMFWIAASICIEKGSVDYNVPFGVWFITPQIALDYNKWFTIAVYLLFMIFMGSVIYYFTRIRYRIFMSFLVFIIPFAIYGKENETMPIPFVIVLSMMYIVLMVYFRQLKSDEKTVLVAKGETWRSVGIFTLVFAVIASLVPKPTVDTDRSVLESMISADRFTDRLVSMLSVFRDTSSGSQYRDVTNNTPLYYAKANEDLHLKTSTFTSYDYSSDVWSSSERERNQLMSYRWLPAEVETPGELTENILKAAELDSSFAEKYGLTKFVGSKVYIPEEEEVKLYSVYSGKTKYAPVPEGMTSIIDKSTDDPLEYMETGLIRSSGEFDRFYNITFGYMSDVFFADPTNLGILNAVSQADYVELLRDASDVLFYTEGDFSINSDLALRADSLDEERKEYRNFEDYLDYGDSDRIYDLAMEITEGLDTDYEKAKAIELYFYKNDFVYDTKYMKSVGENVESFLFRTKRGVCVEYATAMVLLARAAGIPARYCEGFSMSEPFSGAGEYQDVDYVITPQHAHAYPELYIRGYGWTYFEPTLGDSAPEETKRTLAQTLMTAGLFLLGLLVLLIVFILLYPTLSHRFFLARSRKKSANETVRKIMQRICKLYNIRDVYTSHEAAQKVMEISGADIYEAAHLFDEAEYGGVVLTETDKQKAIAEYINAYNAYRETKKKRRITTAAN